MLNVITAKLYQRRNCQYDRRSNWSKITFTDNEEKRNYMVDFTKIKKELGFTTTHTLQDGINTMANALKNKEIELVGSNV